MVDSVIESLNTFKYFVIITTKHEEISRYIINTLHHGVAVGEAVGEFTKDQRAMIHMVCKRAEAFKLRKKIKEIDSSSFIIVTTSSEIIGRGFGNV